MSLLQYTNIDNIQRSVPEVGNFFDPLDLQYITSYAGKYNPKKVIYELHIYTPTGNTLLGSLENIPSKYLKIENNSIKVNIKEILESEFGIKRGSYRFVLNVTEPLQKNTPESYLKQVSTSRTEVLISFLSEYNTEELTKAFDPDISFYQNIFLDLQDNVKIPILNIQINPNNPQEVVCKLYRPIPTDIPVKRKTRIQRQYIAYTDAVDLITKVEEDYLELFPDFDYISEGKGASGFVVDQTYDKLLQADNIETRQVLLDRILRDKGYSNLDTLTDYRFFKNFVHFSSAEERVKNFKYKLSLLEQYRKDKKIIEGLNLSQTGSSIDVLNAKIGNIITNFDGFEKWLYFTSGSVEYTTEETPEVTPWPRDNANRLVSVTSSLASQYYSQLLPTAREYDLQNRDMLVYAIPSLIREDSRNESLVAFVHMLGQYYDNIMQGISLIEKIKFRDEHPKLSLPREIIYNTARTFGWRLYNGRKEDNLLKYFLGNPSGSVQQIEKSTQDLVHETWNRILNNLPELGKSKTTRRSFRTLLNIYGVPDSLIKIKEYGGVVSGSLQPKYQSENQYSYLKFKGTGQSISIPWLTTDGEYPTGISFVIEPFKEIKNNLNEKTLAQTTGSGGEVFWKITTTTDYDNLQADIHLYMSSSAGYQKVSITGEYLLESYPTFVLLQASQYPNKYQKVISQTATSDILYTLYICQHRFGEITFLRSASIEATGSSDTVSQTINSVYYQDSTLTMGSDLVGYLYEVRYYNSIVKDNNIHNMTFNPKSFDNLYEQIVFRHPVRERFDLNTTSSLPSLHPQPLV